MFTANCGAKSCPADSYVDKDCNCMCQKTKEPLDPLKGEWNVKVCDGTEGGTGEGNGTGTGGNGTTTGTGTGEGKYSRVTDQATRNLPVL